MISFQVKQDLDNQVENQEERLRASDTELLQEEENVKGLERKEIKQTNEGVRFSCIIVNRKGFA